MCVLGTKYGLQTGCELNTSFITSPTNDLDTESMPSMVLGTFPVPLNRLRRGRCTSLWVRAKIWTSTSFLSLMCLIATHRREKLWTSYNIYIFIYCISILSNANIWELFMKVCLVFECSHQIFECFSFVCCCFFTGEGRNIDWIDPAVFYKDIHKFQWSSYLLIIFLLANQNVISEYPIVIYSFIYMFSNIKYTKNDTAQIRGKPFHFSSNNERPGLALINNLR